MAKPQPRHKRRTERLPGGMILERRIGPARPPTKRELERMRQRELIRKNPRIT